MQLWLLISYYQKLIDMNIIWNTIDNDIRDLMNKLQKIL